jgi:Icc-related predicted phosphoesterase
MEVNFDVVASFFADDSRVTFLNSETVEYRGLKIYGEPQQPAFFDWAFNIPRDRMNAVWDKVPPNTDVLLTHGPPLGAGDVSRGKQLGCEFQREWILKNKPRLVVCGHIHPGYGYYQLGNTTVINASCLDSSYNPVNIPPVIHLSL